MKKYRKLYSDVPGLERFPPLPNIETDINVLINKDRWKDSKMWNVGISTKRKMFFHSKM